MKRALATFVGIALLIAACGGDDGAKTGTASPTQPATPVTTATPSATTPESTPETASPTAAPGTPPEELAATIWQDYEAALNELQPLLEGTPTAEELAPKIKALKDKYIEKMVAHGHIKEEMSDTARAQVDAALLQSLMTMSTAVLDLMTATQARLYAEGETELADEIVSINIITQYADFELLKQQEPEEAARLGIE